MKASVGDRLITEGFGGQRACVIIGLHNADGSPPYVVRWQTDGHIALMFPGPFTKMVHGAGSIEPSRIEHRRPHGQAPGR